MEVEVSTPATVAQAQAATAVAATVAIAISSVAAFAARAAFAAVAMTGAPALLLSREASLAALPGLPSHAPPLQRERVEAARVEVRVAEEAAPEARVAEATVSEATAEGVEAPVATAAAARAATGRRPPFVRRGGFPVNLLRLLSAEGGRTRDWDSQGDAHLNQESPETPRSYSACCALGCDARPASGAECALSVWFLLSVFVRRPSSLH